MGREKRNREGGRKDGGGGGGCKIVILAASTFTQIPNHKRSKKNDISKQHSKQAILRLHCHALKNKNANHPIQKD